MDYDGNGVHLNVHKSITVDTAWSRMARDRIHDVPQRQTDIEISAGGPPPYTFSGGGTTTTAAWSPTRPKSPFNEPGRAAIWKSTSLTGTADMRRLTVNKAVDISPPGNPKPASNRVSSQSDGTPHFTSWMRKGRMFSVLLRTESVRTSVVAGWPAHRLTMAKSRPSYFDIYMYDSQLEICATNTGCGRQ